MAIIVTGCAGFIGYHVSLALLGRGERVIGIDNLNAYYDPALKRARLDGLEDHAGFRFAKLDVADLAGIKALARRHRSEITRRQSISRRRRACAIRSRRRSTTSTAISKGTW